MPRMPSSQPTITCPDPSLNPNGFLFGLRVLSNSCPFCSQPVKCITAVWPSCGVAPVPTLTSAYWPPDGKACHCTTDGSGGGPLVAGVADWAVAGLVASTITAIANAAVEPRTVRDIST